MLLKKHTETGAMPIVRDPFKVLRQMEREFDRMFEPAFTSFQWPPLGKIDGDEAMWAPEIEVLEKDNRLIARVDLPGMKKDDVSVEVEEGHLVISGERKSEQEEKGKTFYRTERRYGSFYRAIPLPDGVTLADTKATFANGVLEVSVALPARREVKRVKVNILEPTKASKTPA